jgi:predicted ATPase
VITVTGTGGTGKTRLALQAAAELVDEISDGIHWIPLAALRDPALVTSTIAQALGATETLVEFVRDRNLLLVLDNFEHLLDAAPQLAPLLSSAPGLRLLATSRAPLRIEGEYEYPLDPLPARDAVTMFVERARAAGARLERSSVVNEICQRLDCLPLALELAAARSRLLGADALLARLDQRLPLLTGGRRDAPERHRTLHATIDWSHDLLDHAGKTLLARLSVFAGTFSLEAAEAVCDADVGTLAALADLSLLKPVGDGRFLMLETIREYAEERLEADGEAQPVRDRHADWFHRLALEAALHLRDQEQARWLDRLEDDLNNIRAALERADDDRALEIVAALGDFWSVHAHYREADRLLADLLSRNTAATELRAEGLRVAAEVAMGVGDHERSTRLSKEAIELCRSLGLDLLAARCLNNLGGATFEAGDPAAAERYFAESAALRRRIGDVVGAARADSNRALVALERGDHDIAEGVFLATLSVFEESGDTAMVADTFENLAALALMRDDRQAAREWWRRAAAIYRTLRAPERLAFALEGLAAAAAADDDPTDALVLLGAADMLRELSGAPPSVSLEARRAGVRKAAAGLEPAVAEAAHARGFEMTFDEAVEAALAT